MTTKETLEEMQMLMRKKYSLQQDIERARSAATATGGIGDGMPRGTDNESKVERYGTYCADLQGQIDHIDRKLEIYSEDVRRVILAIPEGRHKRALELRFLERLPVSRVARKMHYEREAMYKLIATAKDKWIS